MFENRVKLCLDELELSIKGYEKYRKVEDDSWANIYWKVNNYILKFENYSYDLMSCEVDELRDTIRDFLGGKIKEYKCFIPTEPAFKVRFFPKGDEYGVYYESLECNKLVENPNIEIIVYPVNGDYIIENVGVSFILDLDDARTLYEYLVQITK